VGLWTCGLVVGLWAGCNLVVGLWGSCDLVVDWF
jgi:hypothetical protein